jgi:putative sigma-54 modulation protein
MLQVDIFGREFDVTDRLKEYVESKTSKLNKYLNSINIARVDLTHAENARDPKERYVAQITVAGKGFTLRSEERADDIRVAFDAANQKIQRQIESYKGKHYRGRGDSASLAEEAMKEVEDAYTEDEVLEIARRKQFLLHPMGEDEALEQMKLLGHEDFFVFLNMDRNCVSLLYKRRDGRFGLIDTELA